MSRSKTMVLLTFTGENLGRVWTQDEYIQPSQIKRVRTLQVGVPGNSTGKLRTQVSLVGDNTPDPWKDITQSEYDILRAIDRAKGK